MSLRKNIFQGWVNFESYIHFEAGADTRICFQYDCWCGDDNLEPCKIARNIEATMADILDVSNAYSMEPFYLDSSRWGARVHGFFLGGSVCW